MSLSNLALTPQFVQAVRDAADVVTIASDYTKLHKAGRRYSGLCPLHKEKTPSFSVDPVQGLFYCFGCGAGGDAIKLHMLLSGDDFPAAMESLANRFGIPLPSGPVRRRGDAAPERDLESVLQAAAEFFQAQLQRQPAPQGYLERRRIPSELVARFGLGYAPDGWRHLVGALHPRLPLADLEAAGLVARPEGGGEPYDRFRHRLMFPIRNAAGRLVGFGGRTLGDDKAKYINTAETERFHKGSILYGLDLAKRAVRDGGRALLVEGYFDVLGACASGVDPAVASMGTALTPEQARLLARYCDEVIVGYDGDEAGEAASRRALGLLLAEGLGVRRARWGAGHDPDSLRVAAGNDAVAEAVEKAPDLATLEIERLSPPEVQREPRLRAKAAAAIVEVLKPIRDGILRYGYGRVAASRLGVPVDLLWKRLGVGPEALIPQARSAEGRREVRNLEDSVLALLFGPPEDVPELAELPPPEAFFEPLTRSLYAAYCQVMARLGRAPQPREVLEALSGEASGVDRLAQILLEGPAAQVRTGALAEALSQLARRLERQRSAELQREIAEAERLGDHPRRDRLLSERLLLVARLHPVSPPKSGHE